MIRNELCYFQSDDRSWADEFRIKDNQAGEELRVKIAKSKKDHPGPKVVEYNPPPPTVIQPAQQPSQPLKHVEGGGS